MKKFLLATCLALPLMGLHAEVQRPFKVGAVFPMTGAAATYGQESVNGIKLALEKLKLDKTSPQLELIYEDDKSESIDSANAVRKLVSVDKVDLVFGSVQSSNTLAGAPIAQKAKIPHLTPASTNVKVTEVGNFISRTCFIDDFQGAVMAKFAFNDLKAKTVAVIVDNSSDYSKGLAKAFVDEFKKMGGKILEGDLAYQQKDTDFRSLLRKLKRDNPEAIFLPGYYTEVGLILNQARSMGIKVPFLGGDGWDSPKLQELAGVEGIKNNFLSSHFSPDDADPRVQEFVRDYIKSYKQKPGAMAALGYDGILVVADSLKRAKSFKSTDVQTAINGTKDFVGVTGSITIDSNRNAKKSAVVLETTAKGNIFRTKVSP
jgi:branched-chain amino acid transport system substrate-binding protein